jgi:carbon storage regulator
MLVLSRKKNESIVINDDVTIVIVEIRGDKVRIGVEAPKEVPVHRNEVYEAIRGFNARYDAERPAELADALQVSATRIEAPVIEARPEQAAPAPATRESRTAVAEPPPPDGLCCPQCGSDAVDVSRIKIAHQGKELVRRRKCNPCGHEFHTVERIELL